MNISATSAGPGLAEILERLLGVKPSATVLAAWSARLADGLTATAFVAAVAQSPGFNASRRVASVFPPGHFHSPVVDPATVHEYVARARMTEPDDIAGITLSLPAMLAFWQANAAVIATTPFTENPDPSWRYHSKGGPFPLGDAAMLRAMIHAHRPATIIEIGSGYSTACMLDCADEFALSDLRITCIEPNPTRLRSMLRPGDAQKLDIQERPVQGMSLDPFRALEANDILFIDSTHVLKTGSDVHYELFHILPVLRPGVIVHVHDCQYPFEYPDKWIFEDNFSWNEAYALRAFLMWNNRFTVHFWNSLFARTHPAMIRRCYPGFFPNPGGSIWLQVQP